MKTATTTADKNIANMAANGVLNIMDIEQAPYLSLRWEVRNYSAGKNKVKLVTIREGDSLSEIYTKLSGLTGCEMTLTSLMHFAPVTHAELVSQWVAAVVAGETVLSREEYIAQARLAEQD
jgi:hypothetical protein